MMSLSPVVTTARTEQGNTYKKSNICTYAAAGTMATGAAAYGGVKAVKTGAKIVKMTAKHIPTKQEAAAALTSVKSFVKDTAQRVAPQAKKVLNSAKTAAQKAIPATKSFAQKSLIATKNLSGKAISVVKTVAKKINLENVKNIGKEIVSFAKKLPLKKAAGLALFTASVIAAGMAADFALNKVSALKADKKA